MNRSRPDWSALPGRDRYRGASRDTQGDLFREDRTPSGILSLPLINDTKHTSGFGSGKEPDSGHFCSRESKMMLRSCLS